MIMITAFKISRWPVHFFRWSFVFLCVLTLPSVLAQRSAVLSNGCLWNDETLELNCSDRGLSRMPYVPQNISERMKQLDLVANNLETLTVEDFKNFTELTLVDLRSNIIHVIEDEVFSSLVLPNLEQLFLGRNKLTELSLNVFKSAGFTTLDLSYNNFRYPPPALGQTFQINSLSLNKNPFLGLQHDSLANIAALVTLDLSACNLTSENLAPGVFSDFLELRTLYLDLNYFPYLRREMFATFPSVRDFRCGIEEIDKRAFKDLQSLNGLYLSRNNISELFPNSFQHFSMIYLDLSYCGIQNIRKGALRTRITKRLYLSHNNISVVHDQDFKDLQGVTFIDLSHNGIEEIQGSPFSHLNTLEDLHLHHNHLKDDDKNTERFHTSGMLIHIDLTANELNSIPDFNGKNFPHLQQLDFEQNNITFINETDLRNMTTLYVLILRENPIMEIHRKAFNECWHVTDLNLDYTRFKRLPDMKYMKRLTDLHIVHGQLEDFPEDFCDTSPNLLIIEATFNHVHRFNNFSGCHRLFSLALDHNDISEIPEGSLNGLTNLDVLKLHDNQINSIAPGVFDSLRILKALTLYHNNIRHLPKGIFSGLTALRKLYLAFNQISELPEYIFANNTLLTELVLNDNNIKEIHPTAFPEMPYLQLLNLSSNDFCSLEFPEVGFPSLRTLNLERLWCLHNVPTPHKMPNAQTIHYTYAYHCCLWEDTLNSDIYDENTTTPTTEPPEATQEVTLPPGIVTESDPFEDCQESDGEATDPNPDFSDFAEFYNITIEYGPGCDIKITLPEGVGTALSPEEIADLQNGGATTVLDETIVGTDSEEFFQGVDLFRHHYVPPPEYVPWEEVICYPKPNPLTPCDNLLDPWPIRVTIWTVWVLTLLGNISVLFILIAARQRMDVSQFFICVLAFSNTLLGIYLAFIAMVDIRTLGDRSFYQSALDWQKGSGCQTAGFLAIFSSQLSVYILIILTIERLHHVVRNITVPQPKESGKLRFAVLLIIIGIIYAALLAAFPLRGVGINAYDEVALCLPFVTTTTQDKNYILAVLSLNMLGILIVLIAFLTVFSCLFRPSLSQKKRWELFSSTIKLSLLMFTTFLCWFPIAFVGYSSILQEPIIDAIQAKYFIVFFFPLNALFSPIIYALITRSFRKNIWWIITCCPNVRNKEQSQSFRLIQRQTTSTPTSIMSSDLPRGQSPRSLTGEELRVLRQSRRSNSYSVQFNPSLQQCPTPPTPGTITRMGRRASLPAVFESNATERPSNLYEGTISTEQSPALPFRLAPGLLSQLNNSLPNLPEENELEEAQILESEVIVTTSTEEKVIRKLSTVPEGDEINTLSLELKPTNTPSSASQSARLEATNPEACMYDSVEYKLSGIAEHCMTSTLEPDLSINNSNKDNNIIIPDKDDLQLELKSSSILERNCSPPVKLDFEYERLRDPKVSGRLEIVNPRFAMLSPAEGSETEV